MTRDGTVGRFRRNRAKPGVSSGHRSRLNDEDSVRAPHQGQQSTRTAPTGRTHDCKRPLRCTPNDLLPGGGHPHMRRRDFITLLGGAAAGWPLAARAQQPPLPVIGFLNSQSPEGYAEPLRGLRQGLNESGYVEGENLAIEPRWSDNQMERLPELAAELVRRRVALIITTGGPSSALSAKAATTAIPIVFNIGDDPVRVGLVDSLARPGGNLTGVSFLGIELTAKRLELLRELVPGTGRVAVLVNPADTSVAQATLRDTEAAGRAMGLQIQVFNADTGREIETAFESIA